MKKSFLLTAEELALFRESVKDTVEFHQDRVIHPPKRKKLKLAAPEKQLQAQINASFYFSDEYQPHLTNEGSMRYLRSDVEPHELKKLRRGYYSPDIFLDLHGLTQHQSKQELGALLAACRRENLHCACVMHGHGKHILKQQAPLWLAQHPDVMAFHQAPRKWGGDAALLVLVETTEPHLNRESRTK